MFAVNEFLIWIQVRILPQLKTRRRNASSMFSSVWGKKIDNLVLEAGAQIYRIMHVCFACLFSFCLCDLLPAPTRQGKFFGSFHIR